MNDCPTDPELLRLAALDLDGAERRQLEAHLVGCRRCRRTLAELRSLEVVERPLPRQLRQQAMTDSARRPERAARWLGPAALAAAAVILAVVGWPRPPSQPADPVFSEIRGEDARTFGVTLLEPRDGAVAAGAIRFRWRVDGGAQSARLVIMDEVGDVRFEATTSSQALEVSSAGLGSGTLYWSVEIETADGAQQVSPIRKLRVVADAAAPAP